MAPTLEVRLHALAFGGDAVGHIDGKVVFVPFGAPGDLARIAVVKQHASFTRAQLVELLEPGPGRRAPPCEHFGRCGGCQWQHLDYAEQVRGKEALLAEQLAGDVGRLLPFVGAERPFGYRRRVRLAWSSGGELRVGFFGRRSRELIDVERCPLLGERLAAALGACRDALRGAGEGAGTLALLEGAGGEVHASLRIARGAALDPRALCRAPIVGARVERRGALRCHGAAAIDLGQGEDSPIWASAAAFAQANAAQERRLRERVAAWAAGAERGTLELFAGVGTLTRALAARGEVLALENGAEAAALLRRNAAAWGADVRVLEEDALAGVRALGDERYGLVVVDPPREGLDARLVEALAGRAQRMIYVSCDPMTLRRDLRRLAAAGLVAELAEGHDMMPQTFHVEVVVLLRRLVLLVALVSLASGCAWLRRPPDALDRVTGTEGWREAPAADADAEWKAWYAGRVLWRRTLRDARRERERNRTVSALVGRSVAAPPSRPRGRRGGLRYDPDAGADEEIFSTRPPAARAGTPPPAQRSPHRRRAAPSWRRVPVEQLDDTAPTTEPGVVDEGERRSRDP